MRSTGLFVVGFIAAAALAACGHSAPPPVASGGNAAGEVTPPPPPPAPVDPIVGTWKGVITGIAEADAQGGIFLHLADDAPDCAKHAPDAVAQCSRGTWTPTSPGNYSFTVHDFSIDDCSCGDELHYDGVLTGDKVQVGDEDLGDTFTRM